MKPAGLMIGTSPSASEKRINKKGKIFLKRFTHLKKISGPFPRRWSHGFKLKLGRTQSMDAWIVWIACRMERLKLLTIRPAPQKSGWREKTRSNYCSTKSRPNACRSIRTWEDWRSSPFIMWKIRPKRRLWEVQKNCEGWKKHWSKPRTPFMEAIFRPCQMRIFALTAIFGIFVIFAYDIFYFVFVCCSFCVLRRCYYFFSLYPLCICQRSAVCPHCEKKCQKNACIGGSSSD